MLLGIVSTSLQGDRAILDDPGLIGPHLPTGKILTIEQRNPTTGIGGTINVQLYRVSLQIRDAVAPTLPMVTMPSLLVMELPPGPTCDVLIGMDVLRHCKLIVDGPGGFFALEF